jgi:hypothetical protein
MTERDLLGCLEDLEKRASERKSDAIARLISGVASWVVMLIMVYRMFGGESTILAASGLWCLSAVARDLIHEARK